MFDQIWTDGRGVTLRPSHLTGSNGCTRLPVEGSPLPSKSPSQIDYASSGTDQPAPKLKSDDLPLPLEVPFSHLCVSNRVWACLIFPRYLTFRHCVGMVGYYSLLSKKY